MNEKREGSGGRHGGSVADGKRKAKRERWNEESAEMNRKRKKALEKQEKDTWKEEEGSEKGEGAPET